MPYRKTPIVSGEIYHVFNRSIARQPIFQSEAEYLRVINTINYYRVEKLPLRYSHYNRLPAEQKQVFTNTLLTAANPRVTLLGYSIMPNHFHFLLTQQSEKGVSDFMRLMQNSYSKYFNIKHNRSGSLFQFMFKAVRIESEEQLTHVSRYIHLNPVTACIINANDLSTYRWTSFPQYLGGRGDIAIDTRTVLRNFPSIDAYREFVFDQVSYQRELQKMKHLALE